MIDAVVKNVIALGSADRRDEGATPFAAFNDGAEGFSSLFS